MVSKAKRATANLDIAKTLITPNRPVSIQKARAGIESLNRKFMDRKLAEIAARQKAERQSAVIMEPLLRVIQQDKRAAAAMAKRRQQLTSPRGKPKITFPEAKTNVQSQVRNGSILTIVVPPYDVDWTDGSGYNDTTFGSSVAYKGSSPPRFNASTNIGNGGSAWASAGVGKWFIPAGRDSTFVRIGFFAPYQYNWRDDSNLYTAHSRGFIAIYVQSFDLDGNNPQDEVDKRIQLWDDGTSWYEDHSDWEGGNYPSDTYFPAFSGRQYVVWAWCNTSADATAGSIAYSYAASSISVDVPFMVIEQWT